MVKESLKGTQFEWLKKLTWENIGHLPATKKIHKRITAMIKNGKHRLINEYPTSSQRE